MSTANRIQRHASDLRRLAESRTDVRRRVLCQAPHSLIMAIADVAKAMIKGRLTLSPQQLSKARRHRRALHALANGKTSVERKRRTLTQDGNLVGLLLKPLLSSIAAPLLSGLLGGGGFRR